MTKFLNLLTAVAMLLGAAAPGRAEEGSLPTMPNHHEHHHETMSAAPAASDQSIYLLDAKLVDQDGKTIALDAFRGHPVLVTMFFGNCRQVCPMQIERMKKAEDALDATRRAQYRNLLISLDPERDTPSALAALAEEHGVRNDRWLFAAASEDSVREIAAVLGIRYNRLPDGSFNHSAVISLLDEGGVIRARVEGLSAALDPLFASP